MTAAGRVAGKNGCKIEAETIHVHFSHPVTQAVHNHAPYDWMIGIERVSCAGEIRVTRAVFTQQVIRRIVQATEALRGSVMPILSCVIEYDVENDFDAGPVKSLHHVSKFIQRGQRLLTGTVSPGAAQRMKLASSPNSSFGRGAHLEDRIGRPEAVRPP